VWPICHINYKVLGLTNGRQPAASGRKKKATHTRGRSVVLSTIDATYELTDSILQEWNDKSNIVQILCDSFKAFDSVEHKIPPPIEILWYTSYVRHPQHTQISSNSSTIAADSNNSVTNTRCCRYSCLRSWWWVMVLPKTCRAVSI